MLLPEACRAPGQGGWSKEARDLSEDVGLAMEGAGLSCVAQRPAWGGPHTPAWGGPHRGILTLVSAPPLGRALRLVQTPQPCWRICRLLPLTGGDLSVLGPCAGVCVGGGAQWEGRGRRPIGQVHPQGTWHRVAEETSGLQQGEAEPSDEERPSHPCGCLVLGAASGRRELSLQGRALGVQPGESLQEQKGHGLGSPGLSLL